MKAFELANGKDLEILKNNFVPNHPSNAEKVQAITDLYLKLGVDKCSEEKIKEYYMKAKTYLDKIECTANDTKELESMAKRLIRRDY